jgi:hypothetical protein
MSSEFSDLNNGGDSHVNADRDIPPVAEELSPATFGEIATQASRIALRGEVMEASQPGDFTKAILDHGLDPQTPVGRSLIKGDIYPQGELTIGLVIQTYGEGYVLQSAQENAGKLGSITVSLGSRDPDDGRAIVNMTLLSNARITYSMWVSDLSPDLSHELKQWGFNHSDEDSKADPVGKKLLERQGIKVAQKLRRF